MPPTNSQCVDYGDKLRSQVEAFYAPRVGVIQQLIDEIVGRGGDPTKYSPPSMPAATLDLQKLRDLILGKKSEALSAAQQRQDECNNGAVPNWIGDAQKVLDVATAIALLPLTVLNINLQKEAHVDLGTIFQGKPLGGDQAFFPKLSRDVLDAVGIGGDARKFLDDPVNTAAGAATDAKDAVNSVIEQIVPGIKL